MSKKLLDLGFVQKIRLNTDIYKLEGDVVTKGTEFYVRKTLDNWTINDEPIEKYLIVSGNEMGKLLNVSNCDVIK